MSWSIQISTDRGVTNSDIDAIVKELPDDLKRPFGGSKQSWGWSCAVDVSCIGRYVNDNRKISLSGSCSISGNVAEFFANEFARLIRKRLGCKTRIGKMHV